MNALTLFQERVQGGEKSRMMRRRVREHAPAVGAAVGLIGCSLAAMLGSVLTAASWFVANDGVQHWLSTAGAALLFLTVPLLILSGYCMDWTEKERPKRYSRVMRYEERDDEEE